MSYSRRDAAALTWLAPALTSNGYEVVIDQKDIAPAEVFRSRIEQLILSADVVVFLLSPDSIVSETCAWEVERTLDYGKKLVPLVYRDVDAGQCPPGLAERNWVGDARAWNDDGLSPIATQALFEAIDVDLEWERSRTVWISRAVRWAQAGRPPGQLLRAEEIEAAEVWSTRRPSGVGALGEVLLEFLAASSAREREDRDRLRSITGRAFVIPIARALREHEPDRALRMLATAMVLADDPDFQLIPQLWAEGAKCLLRRPICSVKDAHVVLSTDRYQEETSEYAVSADARLAALHDRTGNVTLFDLTNGSTLWSVHLGAGPQDLHVTEDHGVVAVSMSGEIVRLAPVSGEITARIPLRGEVTQGLTSLVPQRKCLLLAGGDGAALWSYDLQSHALTEMQVFGGLIRGFDYCEATGKGIALIEQADKWVADTFGPGANRRYELPGDIDIYHACFSRDGSTVCVADKHHAMVYDQGSMAEARVRVHHSGKISPIGSGIDTVNLNHDGTLLLTSAHDGTARVWDTNSGLELHRLDHVSEAIITAAGFGPGNDSVFTVGTDCSARVWSLKTSEDIFRIDNRHNGWTDGWLHNAVVGAGLSRDGKRFWVQFARGLAQVWQCTMFEEMPLPAPKSRPDGTGRVIRALQCLGSQQLAACDSDGLLQMFDITTGNVSRRWSLRGHPDLMLIDEPSGILITAGQFGSSAVSLATDQTLWEREHEAQIKGLAYARRSGVIAVGGGAYGSGPGFVEFMNLSGKTLARAAMRGWTCALASQPARSSILVGDVSGLLQEWTDDGDRVIAELDFDHKIEALAVPSSGSHLYVLSDRHVWRVSAGLRDRQRIFRLDRGASSMACDPHDEMLFIEGYTPVFVDLRRGVALLLAQPSEYDGNDPEEFWSSSVTDDWGAMIGVTSKGRWLRRSLHDLGGIVKNPAGAIARALENGNDVRRATERLDVLMSEQPDDLLSRVRTLAGRHT